MNRWMTRLRGSGHAMVAISWSNYGCDLLARVMCYVCLALLPGFLIFLSSLRRFQDFEEIFEPESRCHEKQRGRGGSEAILARDI